MRLPKKVTIIRTAMIGGGMSYSVEVPKQYVPDYNGTRYTTIHRGDKYPGKEYVRFVDATLDESHFSMPTGWDRWEAFKAHEKLAKEVEYRLAVAAFPELSKIGTVPLLWALNLLPVETSAEVTLDVEKIAGFPWCSTCSDLIEPCSIHREAL